MSLRPLAVDVLAQPEPFKGKIGLGVKDSIPDWPQPIRAPQGAPNIVVILLDDAGFADAGSFGGLVDTPAIDQLAKSGLRYNRFHATAVCSPTRAALLSGRNHHRVGFGTIPEAPSGFPGYDTVWKKNTTSVAEVLRRNGYSTAAFGKWHNTPDWEVTPVGPFDRWPTGLGFEYFYGFLVGETSQWEPPLYRNTTAVDPPKTAEEGYHATADFVDDAIRWVRTHESLAPEKPYFLYFATGATHKPHHVPKEWVDKYRGRFDEGWDSLREKIFARQKELGLIPIDAELTPRPPELPAWCSLSAETRKLVLRQMEVYAGFRAQTDYEIGRLLEVVQQGPKGNNTLIMYIASDNGASGMDGLQGNEDTQAPVDSIESQLQRMDELGGPRHLNAYAAGWAWMNNTPFQWMKLAASHFGGSRVPFVVSWPRKIKAHGEVRSQFTHVNAVAATLYEAVGVTFPKEIDGIKQLPLDGPSFEYTFDQPNARSRHRVQYFENWGNRAIYQDGWIACLLERSPVIGKLSTKAAARTQWELYHVEEDYSQTRELAKLYPDKLKTLQQLFDMEAGNNGVYPIGATFTSFRNSLRPSTRHRTEFIYYPGMPRLPSREAPDFLRSHRIAAETHVGEAGAEGVLVANGSRFGGFVLYVKNSRLVYENNYRGKRHDVITSTRTLPAGKVEMVFEFVREATHGDSEWVGGIGRLYINGEMAGEGRLTQVTSPYYGTATFSIGRDSISPVSSAYRLPFRFTGGLMQVKVSIDSSDKQPVSTGSQ